MKEREISLVDLIFEILLKWRMIIVFMVIGGLLLGGYSYLQSAKTAKIQNNQSSSTEDNVITLDDLESKLTIAQRNNVKAVLEYEEYSKYYEESILMQIDANNTPTTELIFCIETADEKDKKTVVSIYTQLLSRGITEWLIQSGMEFVEATKVIELIDVANDVNNQMDISLSGNKGTVCVSVKHLDEEKSKALANQIKEFVYAKKIELENVYGAHEVRLISESYAPVMDLNILNKQRTAMSNAIAGNTSSDKLKQAFTSDELKYYDLLKKGVSADTAENTTGDTTAVPEPAVVTSSPSVSIKYVVLGVVLFAFIYVFYVFMAHILNNKLRTNDNLTDLFGMVQLGIVPAKENKKKFLGFVDGWILAIRNRNKRKFTVEEAEEIVAVAIKIAVKKSEGKEVCLVGCDVKRQTNDICKNIQSILEKEDIKVKILDNVLYNAEEMEKLENVSYVVLVEKTGSTMYDEVAKELELLERYNINVLGGILVE